MSPTDTSAIIVWFRQDLRLADHPALAAGAGTGSPVIPVYILDDQKKCRWNPGAASRWWLHHSLAALTQALRDCGEPEGSGPRLILRRGDPEKQILQLCEDTGARAVYWNRCYEPRAVDQERRLTESLMRRGLEAKSFKGSVLAEPEAIRNATGGPYRVFAPFWRALTALPIEPPLRKPRVLRAVRTSPHSDRLADWTLLPRLSWADGFGTVWTPGEVGAHQQLRQFINRSAGEYATVRDRPDLPGTSRLSPHLHFGEVSPRQIWHAIRAAGRPAAQERSRMAYLRELGWREFSCQLLYHHPFLPEQPLREEFRQFPWTNSARLLRAWQRGQTGFPIVDAGMKELWTNGWMHNRIRMITASFLVKDLLVPWQEGEAWFWDTLVDADLANNSANWQWVAGCGADAAPWFRIFNPVLQGQRFDPQGAYVRRWLPVLAALPDKYIHAPWEAPANILQQAGLRLGQTYPMPIVRHTEARRRALEAFDRIKAKSG